MLSKSVDGGETWSKVVEPGTKMIVRGKSHYGWGTSYWSNHSRQVVCVQNGDSPPKFSPYANQPDIETFLAPVLDAKTGLVTIDDNEVLYLYELGSTNTNSSAFDMQDLVVLMTATAADGGSQVASDDGDDNTCVISGGLNINPNNSPHSEFILKKSGGGQITRDDLHNRSSVSGNGTYYEGGATWIRVKPKGNGNQNTLIMNGKVYNFHNGTTYVIESNDMTAHIWNSKVKNGRCMGHWWLDINANDVTINGECESDDDDLAVDDDDDCSFYFRDKIPNVTVVYGDLKVSDNEKLCGIYIVYGDFEIDGNAQVDGVVAMPKPGTAIMNGGSNPDIKNITGGMVVDAGVTASGKYVSVKYKPEYMSIFSSFQKKSGIMLTRWLESTAY